MSAQAFGGYAIGILFSLMLHMLLLGVLQVPWGYGSPPERENLRQPIRARLGPAPRPAAKPKARPKPKPRPRASPGRARPQPPKSAPRPDAKARAGAAPKAAPATPAETHTDSRLDSLRQAMQEQLQDDEEALDPAAEARAVEICRTYLQREVAGNWIEPPGARPGMRALVSVRLLPSGALDSVRVQSSSGHAGFDRSVEHAVRQAAPFTGVSNLDLRLFDRHCRRVQFLFAPTAK